MSNKEQREYQGNKVTFMTTDRCNAKCKHCHLDYKGHFTGERLKNLVQTFGKKHSLKLNGAEILMHPEYFEILKTIGQKHFVTNGLGIAQNPNVLIDLKKHGVNSITVSHHFDAHDLISPVPTAIVDKTIELIKEADMRLWLMTVVNKDNYKKVEQMCEQAIGKGACAINFSNLLNTGKATSLENNKTLNDEQIGEFMIKLQEVRNKYDKSVFNVTRGGAFGKIEDVHDHFNCPAGIDSVVITPDEKVVPCIGMTGNHYEIGHIESDKIIIDKKLYHDGKKCLIHEIANRGVDFKDYLER